MRFVPQVAQGSHAPGLLDQPRGQLCVVVSGPHVGEEYVGTFTQAKATTRQIPSPASHLFFLPVTLPRPR
jgi:hypothetical protein